MERKAFESLVHEAIQELPQQFKDKLANVAILVEDYPSDDLLEQMDVPEDETLFGLFEGVPLTDRGHFDVPLHPDRVWIFCVSAAMDASRCTINAETSPGSFPTCAWISATDIP